MDIAFTDLFGIKRNRYPLPWWAHFLRDLVPIGVKPVFRLALTVLSRKDKTMKVEYKFADGTVSEVEVSEEIRTYIMDSRRKENSANRKERYHLLSAVKANMPSAAGVSSARRRSSAAPERKQNWSLLNTSSGCRRCSLTTRSRISSPSSTICRNGLRTFLLTLRKPPSTTASSRTAINWWHRVPTVNTATRKQSPKLLSKRATKIFTRSPSSPSPRWRSSGAKRHLPRLSANTSQSRKANPRSSRHPISVRLSMLRVQKMIFQ